MFVVSAALLQRIPRPANQFLSYLSQSSIAPGTVISVPLRRRNVQAVVFDCQEPDKQEIKRADFTLKPIDKIISPFPLLEKWQLRLCWWLSEYYYCSPGSFLKMMLPKGALNKSFFARIKPLAPPPKRSQHLILAPTLIDIEKIQKEQTVPHVFHSALKTSQQKEIWLNVKNNRLKTIVGTKAALFLPFSNLKKITVIKESNAHHKSWDMSPHWRVHEAVLKTGELLKIKTLFESFLPSVESFYRAKQKKINLEVSFPSQHPTVKIIDQRQEFAQKNASVFSRDLQGAIENHLRKKEPIILFNLRRGAATFVLCRRCGHTALCPECEVALVKHNLSGERQIWLCHHCGYSQSPEKICPECASDEIKEYGVGSQKVEATAKILWPQARIERLDSDSAPDIPRQKTIVGKFNRGQIDILISTPVIFSYAVKKVSLAAIVSADTILNLPDFRSSERLFKIISLTKKLTRDEKSFLLIQTFSPEDRTVSLAAKSRFGKFYQEELQARKILDYPPFCQIIKLTTKDTQAQKAIAVLKTTATRIKEAQKKEKLSLEIFGPLPAFIPKERKKFVYNLILKFKPKHNGSPLTGRDLFARNEILKYAPSNVFVDVDPESIL